jgi:hypothetical protein
LIPVGIVDAQLGQQELFSATDPAATCIIVSTHGTASLLDRTSKDVNAYVLVEIAAQLLTIEFRRQLSLEVTPEECGPPWHNEIRVCLFDYCDDRSQTGRKLINPRLCDVCKGELAQANVRNSVIEACLTTVRKALRPHVVRAASNLLRNRWVTFLFGGVVSRTLTSVSRPFGFEPWQADLLVMGVFLLFVWRELRNPTHHLS